MLLRLLAGWWGSRCRGCCGGCGIVGVGWCCCPLTPGRNRVVGPACKSPATVDAVRGVAGEELTNYPTGPILSSFNPLQQQRAIVADEALTSTQQHVLLVMTLRTDNNSGRVRYSQRGIAAEAHLGHATVERALRAPAVRRYFVMERDERDKRRVNLTWRYPSLSSRYPSLSAVDTPHSEAPSTSTSTPTSTSTGASKLGAPLVSANWYRDPTGKSTCWHHRRRFCSICWEGYGAES